MEAVLSQDFNALELPLAEVASSSFKPYLFGKDRICVCCISPKNLQLLHGSIALYAIVEQEAYRLD